VARGGGLPIPGGQRLTAWANWVKPGGARRRSGRRQPSRGDTSLMTTGPSPAHRYTFGLTVGAACAFPLASPARFSRSIQEPGELRAAYMPDAAWAVSVHPQADPGRRVNPRFGIV
jgi:hypothetical protein